MLIPSVVVAVFALGARAGDGIRWIDGRDLPIEGRAFGSADEYYDRLPASVTTNVNAGVREMKHHTSGEQFRFATDSKRLTFKWMPRTESPMMDHMPATGHSGIDVYARDKDGRWRYKATGRIRNWKTGGTLEIAWEPGVPCLVNLPLYNGLRWFRLGIDEGAKVSELQPRPRNRRKPVVFYGTSITQGGCASRPGMSFVNIVGRNLDVPVVNLGFSGSGLMEQEMSEHLAAIDAGCYVLDCLWNMDESRIRRNYEPFIRNLRRLRPNVPIVMAERCDVFGRPRGPRDEIIRKVYEKLVAEGWRGLTYLSKGRMYVGGAEGTVDGAHPNDWGMVSMADAFGAAVATAMGLGAENDASCTNKPKSL